MPRSERFYTFMLVAVMSLVVVFSVVTGIRTMKGDTPPRPSYEKTPPLAFVQPPSNSIVDISNTAARPIDDAEFLLFHRTTRVLTPLVIDRGMKEAHTVVLDNAVVTTAQRELDVFNSVIADQRNSAAKNIKVVRPVTRVCDLAIAICQRYCPASTTGGSVYICERARTSASVSFVQRSTSGSSSTASVVAVNWEWLRTPAGWKVVAISPQLVTAADDTTVENPTDNLPDPEDPTEETTPDTSVNSDPNAPIVSP
jgi:hypothetical protein